MLIISWARKLPSSIVEVVTGGGGGEAILNYWTCWTSAFVRTTTTATAVPMFAPKNLSRMPP